MAERGVAWRVWWDDVLHGWDIYHLINARLKGAKKSEISHVKRRWSLKLARSASTSLLALMRI
jgi:hypothetical protein